jgi:shikimate kinase
MGTGKSTVGRALADACGAAFADLDARVEELAGKSIGEIFRDEGEPQFRAIERGALLAELATTDRRVVATGGGALLELALRERALARAFVVVLAASVATIAARTRGSHRPLLKRDPEAQIVRLLEERALAYAEGHVTVATDGLEPAEVVATVRALWTASR